MLGYPALSVNYEQVSAIKFRFLALTAERAKDDPRKP
jgi:hypothetical protein